MTQHVAAINTISDKLRESLIKEVEQQPDVVVRDPVYPEPIDWRKLTEIFDAFIKTHNIKVLHMTIVKGETCELEVKEVNRNIYDIDSHTEYELLEELFKEIENKSFSRSFLGNVVSKFEHVDEIIRVSKLFEDHDMPIVKWIYNEDLFNTATAITSHGVMVPIKHTFDYDTKTPGRMLFTEYNLKPYKIRHNKYPKIPKGCYTHHKITDYMVSFIRPSDKPTATDLTNVHNVHNTVEYLENKLAKCMEEFAHQAAGLIKQIDEAKCKESQSEPMSHSKWSDKNDTLKETRKKQLKGKSKNANKSDGSLDTVYSNGSYATFDTLCMYDSDDNIYE